MSYKVEMKVIGFVANLSGLKSDKINKSFSLVYDLPLDSLAIAELLAVVEDEYDVDVPDGYRPQTIGDLVNFVETQC